MKYLAQILVSVIYTPIISTILCLAVLLPVWAIIGLSWWKILITLFLVGGLIEWMKSIVVSLCTMPYAWINRNNAVATWIAAIIAILTFLRFDVVLWQMCHSGFALILLSFFVTAELLSIFYAAIVLMFAHKEGIMFEK